MSLYRILPNIAARLAACVALCSRPLECHTASTSYLNDSAAPGEERRTKAQDVKVPKNSHKHATSAAKKIIKDQKKARKRTFHENSKKNGKKKMKEPPVKGQRKGPEKRHKK